MTDAAISFSRRVQAVRPSPTLAISARAIDLRRAGRDIASLSVGEPDFPVFPHVAKAIADALEKGHTKYTASPGTMELRESIAKWMLAETGVRYAPAQIIATAGAKQALYNACQALLDEGDEAVIPNPYWVSYPDMVRLAGATVRELVVTSDSRWIPRPEALEKAITPRTRVVMLGSPSNPTGAVWTDESLRAIAAVLARHPRIVVLADDIYGRLVYGGAKAKNLLALAPELTPRTVLINGCSKAYAMTGLRLGWAAGPQAIISAMNKVQDSSTSNPSSLAQYAAVAALNGPQEPVEAMRVQFERRRDLMHALVTAIPGVTAHKPDGAYYVFPDVSAYLGRKHRGEPVQGTVRLAEVLLEEHGVAVVPGSAFGPEGYLRLSFATSDAEIRRGVERLAKGLAALEK
ncbi:MAG: pyridoxal phosphate-dependent aminotransferase [Myxococcales bacterium]